MDKKREPKNGKKIKITEEAKVGLVVTLSAALFFGGILAINSLQRNNDVNERITISVPVSTSTSTSEGPVVEVYDPMKELLVLPVDASIEQARTFYDPSDDEATRMTAIVHIGGDNSRTLRSYGVDYQSESKFNVEAAFSGTVIDKSFTQDYGNVITIKHESGVVSYYASLGEIFVNKNQEVRQGDIIGCSGTSPYTAALKDNSVHFEIKNKNNEYVNPTKSIDKLVKDL